MLSKKIFNTLAFMAIFGLTTNAIATPPKTTKKTLSQASRKPYYVTEQNNAAVVASTPIIRVYQNSIPWFGDGRDNATIVGLGLVLGENYFVHPLSDLASGVPAGTSVVFLTSNADAFSTDLAAAAITQNDPAAQASLEAFVQAGGTLIINMADNLETGGFIAPGASGTPDLIFPLPQDHDATLTSAALGNDAVLGTADDHPIVLGPDGKPGTGDDLNNSNIDACCSVAHGNLADGIKLPADATVLMTANFNGIDQPILAEYPLGSGRIILNTLTAEFSGHQPEGAGASYFLYSILHNALKLPPPIPEQVKLAVNSSVLVTKAGVATISGTISCSPRSIPVDINITLHQKFNRNIAQGFGYSTISCNGTAKSWSVPVISNNSTIFGAGRADIILNSFYQASPVEYTSANITKTLTLNVKK